MNIQLNNPKQALNKAYLKEKVSRADIELFKKNLTTLFNNIGRSSDEEHLKSQVAYFLRDTWYKDSHQINPIEKNDLAIHTGKSVDDAIGVIIEVKSITNRAEMISEEKLNAKALHELILYYLRERIDRNNNEIKYLIATNIEEWFVFDSNEFDKKIYRNTAIKKLYELKKSDHKDNPFFYEELRKILEQSAVSLEASWFNITHYKGIVLNNEKKDDNKLIALYKIFSPVHLLKLSFTNDSNSLDTKFYAELLHIIGLEEIKEGSKKLIKRKEKHDSASILENAIIKLEDKDCLRHLSNLSLFGSTKKDQLFNVALELCITWINRVLFLKLLEAQLSKYHKGNKEYQFLNANTIYDFDELSNLFFQVLAERHSARREHLKEKFNKVPYLNSSLFERTELERQTFDISALENRLELPLFSSTVLKDKQGKRKSSKLQSLQYLFEFLDAYDFTSEGSEEIQEENKNLISASVLGLIFEKINGYKDGSFFTPGFVTMYMCKETIRRAVIQKFNEHYKIDCETIDDLKNFLSGRFKTKDVLEFNSVINELKICDPAVGSGHFLVSALNEIIAIKAELGLLADKEGLRLTGYEIKIENDELIITYNNNTEIFEYTVISNSVNTETQRIQKTLFHEKESLIENCLFGVDINQNSVKICRLRLWIELLKNAYYTEESHFKELETLPNIDINIKCGNSLISRFPLDADIKSALRKSKWNIDSYKLAVQTYREAESKEQKHEMEELIEKIKKDFRSYISPNDPKVKKLSKLRGDLFNLSQTKELFDERNKKTKETKKKIEELNNEIIKLETTIEEIKNNKIYENAFEWRFEFPEVLDNDGVFGGFDVIIGNPPYLQIATTENSSKELKEYLIGRYKSSMGRLNTFGFFTVLGIELLKPGEMLSFILPNTILMQDYYEELRKFVLKETTIKTIVLFDDLPFQEAVVENAILTLEKTKRKKESVINVLKVKSSLSFDLINKLHQSLIENNHKSTFNTNSSESATKLIQKISAETSPLGKWTEVNQAIALKHDRSKWVFTEKKDERYKPLLVGGKNIGRYSVKWDGSYLKYDLSGIHSCKREDIFLSKEKIFFRRVSDKIIATLDREQFYALHTIVVINNKPNSPWELPFILALLNSKLINWYYYQMFSSTKTVFTEIGARQVELLPIKDNNQKYQTSLADLVNKILEIKEMNPKTDTMEFEEEIDNLIFGLYRLTAEEIKIVEQN